MRWWRERGGRQLVLAHELYAAWSWIPHRWWYVRQQRRQWHEIRRVADALGLSTETWLLAERSKSSSPDSFFFCPSPSNISNELLAPGHRAAWRATLGWPETCLVLGVFGSLGPPSRWRMVEEAWKAARAGGLDARLVSFGQAARADFLREEPTGMALGFVDEPTASRALSACDVLALPFLDGLSERRCSAMAGFAHGCCVGTTLGSSTGPSLRKADFFAATPAADVAAYVRLLSELLRDARRRGELGGKAAAAYRSQYDWPGVSAVLRAQIERLRSEPR